MSSAKREAGVVSSFDPNDFEIEWRDIPGYSAYQASNTGLVRHTRLNRISNFGTKATTKGTYLRVGILPDDRTSRDVEVHTLVCLAFHGLPPEPEGYEVNHKDTNKHNNLPGNLEWMTRGENLTHAYQEGLRKENRLIMVHDHVTGQTTEYYAMAEVGRVFALGKGELWSVITNHQKSLYLERYTFKFNEPQRTIANKKPQLRSVRAYDYRKQQLLIANDLGSMELMCGIKRGTIYYNLTRGKTSLVRGFVFLYMGTDEQFPSYTEEEVNASLSNTAGNGSSIRVTDTVLNTTEVYGSFQGFVRAIGEKHVSTVRRIVERTGGRYQHYLVEYL